MTNVTLTIDDRILRDVDEIAARRHTTVQMLVVDYLRRVIAEDAELAETRRQMVELAESSTGRLGPDYTWDRKNLYEDRAFPRHQRPDLFRTGKTG